MLRDGDRVLVCQRGPAGPHPGQWEFPGGKLEAGESVAACLERELREELAIEARVGAALDVTEFTYPGGPYVRIHFVAVPSYQGTIENRIFAEVRWQPIARLDELDFLAADRRFLQWLERNRPPESRGRTRPPSARFGA